jgi:hypothetical protein
MPTYVPEVHDRAGRGRHLFGRVLTGARYTPFQVSAGLLQITGPASLPGHTPVGKGRIFGNKGDRIGLKGADWDRQAGPPLLWFLAACLWMPFCARGLSSGCVGSLHAPHIFCTSPATRATVRKISNPVQLFTDAG